MPHTVKFHIRVIAALKFLVRLLHSHGGQGIDILLQYHPLLRKFIVHMRCDGPKYPARRRNADLRKRRADILLQCFLHCHDGIADLFDIVNLSVQHGTGFMLLHPLCHHNETLFRSVSHRSHYASGTDIQSKHRFSLMCYSCHVYASSLFLTCSYASASVPPLSITKSQFCLNRSSVS